MASRQPSSTSDLELLEELARREARQSFWAFRQYFNPKNKWGWFQKEVAQHLQQFAMDVLANKRPKLVIQAPPQHGKSTQVVDWIAWFAGHDPDLQTIYTSFSERLGIRANLKLQRIYDSQKYQLTFPETQISKSNAVTVSSQNLRNREIIEYAHRDGYFRNTTVNGAITGEGLHIGVVDDPVKGREAAGSQTIRDKTWDWFTDDFFSRFSDEKSGLLCILTRWHLDDPIGRLIKADSSVKVLSYPALAVHDELHRKQGEALFPEHKSREFLLERKGLMAASSWESLYQQNPIVIGGEIIRGEWFRRYSVPPRILYRKIYADTAQKTKERNDYSVFECWGFGDDGKIYLLDLIRGKWEAPELKRRAVDFWQKHKAKDATLFGELRQLKVEDKSSGTGLIQEIKRDAKIPVSGIQRNTDKLTRVMDGVGYIESGYVLIPDDAPWVADFITECESFTADNTHSHDDQIDPLMDAIKDMLGVIPGMGIFDFYADQSAALQDKTHDTA